MGANNEEITDQQRAFIPYYIMTGDHEKAAKAIGADPVSAKRWLRNPLFAQEIQFKRRQVADKIVDMLAEAATSSVTALHNIVNSSAAESNVLKAATSILDQFWKGHENQEFAARIQAIEQRIKGQL